jgi:CitMHS family citrate-Mg2+:H+ or citrate-Ca2+:H+ symporter
MGKKEGKRIGFNKTDAFSEHHTLELTEEQFKIRRPGLFWFNILLTISNAVVLISGVAPASG